MEKISQPHSQNLKLSDPNFTIREVFLILKPSIQFLHTQSLISSYPILHSLSSNTFHNPYSPHKTQTHSTLDSSITKSTTPPTTTTTQPSLLPRPSSSSASPPPSRPRDSINTDFFSDPLWFKSTLSSPASTPTAPFPRPPHEALSSSPKTVIHLHLCFHFCYWNLGIYGL